MRNINRELLKWPDSYESLNEPDPIKSNKYKNKYKNHPSIKKKIKSKHITAKPFFSDQLLPKMSLMLFLH